MKIIVGKLAGFCFGVANAVNKTSELLKQNKNICCLGELVHNKQVINELEENGLTIIDDISQAKKSVIIQAHGEPKETYSKAKDMGLNIIDLTCPKVINIHKIANQYAKVGYYIFLVGNNIHPETIGTISYCGKNSCIIENEEDIQKALQNLYSSKLSKLVVLAQTTFSLNKFNKIIKIIQEEIKDKNIDIKIETTICDATKLRQEETERMSLKVDTMIIIGGKHSSNTNKLYEIAKKNCSNSILIESKEELDLNKIKKNSTIGIVAGASTPQESVKEVVEMLNKV